MALGINANYDAFVEFAEVAALEQVLSGNFPDKESIREKKQWN